uniref:PLD nuclease N-terminal domain-containing protein n=1 Tax=Roseihalotalea indica TaxID=2867963 RepID=A0AA49GRQ8_9BACT|nr:PLD nuclease N-terminal domain-containing protein [Tunicatimonas sp. TK19036]
MITTLTFIGGLGGWEVLFLGIPFLLGMLLWLYALIDVLRSQFRKESDKIIWVLVVIFLQFLGAIIYLVVGKSQKVR